ncbi:hypothetical protein ISG33_14340 [Glaciecola sp. MH2013]|uniref:hypothetical protein n=1 Tax=Glaciecola sp. MH2013 TaxID=2785524 RepID=UPI00189F270F|nr:hypothetical protein [Glaciecola sp. MH2013]MBF7074581.1 hypothetical protein [Glaciecola sp. MH2013]
MRSILAIVFSMLILSCSKSWKEEPYEVIWIDGNDSLAYSVGNGAYIGRVDFPERIASNDSFISVYACEEETCTYYYIDKLNDHKYADHDEFVYGPFFKYEFVSLKGKLGLPDV